MKCTLSTQAWKWHSDSGGWAVGKTVTCNGLLVTHEGFQKPIDVDADVMILMSHSHTRELEFVRLSFLQPYGPPRCERMPEPELR